MGKVLCQYPTPGDHATAPGRVIFVELAPGKEYATWWQNDNDGGRSHGHYFNNWLDGIDDFAERCRRGY